jgi:sugar lactone lactonase YvrE
MLNTLAGAAMTTDALRFKDPFGVAVAGDGGVYVSDGGSGTIWQIAADEIVKQVAGNLDVPSAIAFAPDGTLVVAETGSHTVVRVDPRSGQSQLIAGVRGRSGFKDGDAATALFNAPVGVAVGTDGTIYVADTYNDRIRAIDAQSRVRTLAGGDAPGMVDAPAGADARFDTPCGIAVAADGALMVADTGNNRLRRVEQNGAVKTIAGTGERGEADGTPFAASFDEPMGLAVETDGTVYVADAGGSTLRVYRHGTEPQVLTLIAHHGSGVFDGPLADARVRAPSGVAVASNGTLIIADTGNRLVRVLIGEKRERGKKLTEEALLALYPTAAEMRRSSEAEARWPYDPATRPREIAATFGEVRGEITATNREAYFHNGLDIPGAYGEIARAVREERVLLPLAVEDVGTTRERIRFPQLGYIHLRVGRDQSDRVLDDRRFQLRHDPDGRVVGVRVRRGERFAAGDPLGTLNNQYHVHLIAGPVGGELNALAALELPGVKDTVAPVIEKDGVRLFNREWQELRPSDDGEKGKAKDERITVEGDVRIVVRAYDQMDGNAQRRRLGIYRLGYQILRGDGTPAQGFDQPQITISFETLPANRVNAAVVYAEGSRSGATGETIFAYIVTNIVRDYRAEEGFWQSALLPAGDYTVRVLAEDFFGNRTTRDIPVRVVTPTNKAP